MQTRKSFLYLLIIAVFYSGNLAAQKIINEATFSYKITTESANDKVAMAKSLEGATFTVFIKGTQSRTDMVSALGTESNLFDSRQGKGVILKQYSGQKLMITLTQDDWAQKNKLYQNIKFNIDNTEQTIAGFKCKKATGQSSDGKTLIIYFADDIVLSNKQYNNAFTQLPGVPVQYELQSGNLKFRYTLSNINYDAVPAGKFEVPASGYRSMSYEENQKLRKEEN